MENNYGVYTKLEGGTIVWVTGITPLTTGPAEDAIKWNEQDALATATYLNSLGEGTYFIGRVPKPHT